MQFDASFFEGNRQRLLEVLGDDALCVLSANGLMQRSADTTFDFRQDSNFWYLTGINEPDCVLVLSSQKTLIIMPARAEHRDMWDGELSTKELKINSGIDEFYEHTEGWNLLDRMIKKTKKVHTATPFEAYFEHFGFYANPARGTLLTELKRHRSIELVDIRRDLARLRQVKQPIELAAIQEAIDITGKALKHARKKLTSYKYEYEIVADVTADFLRNGAKGHGYSPIVAADKNAATIHYIKNDSKLEQNSLILFDVGAEVSNYSADISRTYAVYKTTPRQRAVYKAVKEVQDYAMGLLKPGVKMREYESKVDLFMAKQLKKLNVIDDITDKKRLKKYFPHLCSHFLGLDVHDSADYELPLKPNMVLTVEPGIYIPEESIGIRIEDNVRITETGIEVLSSAIDATFVVQ